MHFGCTLFTDFLGHGGHQRINHLSSKSEAGRPRTALEAQAAHNPFTTSSIPHARSV
jgi:hypothetical protein